MTLTLTENEQRVLKHLLHDALGGWGEPWKDFELDREIADQAARELLVKLTAELGVKLTETTAELDELGAKMASDFLKRTASMEVMTDKEKKATIK